MPPTPPTTNSHPASTTPATSSAASKPKGGKKLAAKPDSAEPVLVDKTVQKTARKSSAKPKAKDTKSSFERPAEAEWHRLISEAAYYRAESRGFHPGYEHEDWLWAEDVVRKRLTGGE